MTHTPGPWIAVSAGATAKTGIDTPGKFRYRAHWDGPGDNAELEANAHLIAAAPELLEALEGVMGWYGLSDCRHMMAQNGEISQYNKTCNLARAAIAKARGG